MFGREYHRYPKVLLNSFGEMSEGYKGKKNKSKLLEMLFKSYIFVFGIPEIGFQIRCLYFKHILFPRVKDRKNILDAGSGIGIYTFWLNKNYKDSNVLGTDIDRQKLKIAKELVKNFKADRINFEIDDVTTPPKKKSSFDLIVTIDVLEHVKDYKKVIKNFSQRLTKGGYLYIHTPQANQKRFFKSLENWEHESHEHEGFTKSILKKELEKNGMKLVISKNTFGFFGKLAWELNHIALGKSFILAGILYPALYIIARLDLSIENKEGLGIAVLAKKIR